MEKLTTWLRWLDTHLIKILLVGYIFFMPLWPKLPVTMINYTYVGIRGDDFYSAFFFVVFLIQVLRKKIKLELKFALPIFLFWAAAFLSMAAGAFIQYTIDYPQLGFLHAARRVQYMVIFFIAMSAIYSKKDFYFFMRLMISALGIVSIYGIGQKYIGWPAVQTMNPEYAKGYVLELGIESRISSTFAGHYDLAAYLILLIPIVLGFYLARDKVIFFVTYVFSLLAMILTSSRASFGSYILSTLPYLVFMRRFKLLIIVVVLTVAFTFLSQDLAERITRTFQASTVFVEKDTGETQIAQDMTGTELPAGGVAIGQKEGTATEEELSIMRERIREDLETSAAAEGRELTEEEKERLIAERLTNFIPVKTTLFDTSTSVRLQASWPQAINAWQQNYILGSGPSSLGEASDGDYFRWLGEFGLLGTGLFLYVLFSIAKYIWDFARKVKPDDVAIYYGFLFGLAGLLINATYIDVFEASKLAYSFWLIAGLFVGSVIVRRNEQTNKAHSSAKKHKKS